MQFNSYQDTELAQLLACSRGQYLRNCMGENTKKALKNPWKLLEFSCFSPAITMG